MSKADWERWAGLQGSATTCYYIDTRKPEPWRAGIRPLGQQHARKGPPPLRKWGKVPGQLTLDETLP